MKVVNEVIEDVATTIGKNMAALKAQTELLKGSNEISKLFERLSTGMRINHAIDDPAGLAVSSGLNADVRVFTQGIRNFNDGISLLNVADGALSSLSNITVRLKELAEQAANGVYSATQRSALNTEGRALVDEYNRITQTTSFNGIQLLNGSLTSLTLQGGYGTNGSISTSVGTQIDRYIGTGTFATSVSYGLALSTGATIGDFNEDGILDIIVQNSSANRMGILIGNGDGTFQANVSFTIASSQPNQTIAADFNGDGHLDLVGFNKSVAGVGISLGAGNGTFSSYTTFVAGTVLTTTSRGNVSVGDINGDGNQDIAQSDYITGQVNIFIGNGNGTFSAGPTMTGFTSNQYAELKDLNGDGQADLALSNSGVGNELVFISNGDGTFKRTASFGGFTINDNVVFEDLNNDGNMDFILASYGQDYVNAFLGNGDGTFAAGGSYNAGTAGGAVVRSMKLADFNNDGLNDLLVGSANANSYILYNNGNGTFSNRTTITSSYSSANIVGVGDFNQDGVYDFLALTSAGSPSIDIQNHSLTTTISYVNLLTQANARTALTTLDSIQANILAEQGSLGATQSRLGFGLRALQSLTENTQAAASRITDVDIAETAAELVRRQILQQAGMAVLAQANQNIEIGLKLIQGATSIGTKF